MVGRRRVPGFMLSASVQLASLVVIGSDLASTSLPFCSRGKCMRSTSDVCGKVSSSNLVVAFMLSRSNLLDGLYSHRSVSAMPRRERRFATPRRISPACVTMQVDLSSATKSEARQTSRGQTLVMDDYARIEQTEENLKQRVPVKRRGRGIGRFDTELAPRQMQVGPKQVKATSARQTQSADTKAKTVLAPPKKVAEDELESEEEIEDLTQGADALEYIRHEPSRPQGMRWRSRANSTAAHAPSALELQARKDRMQPTTSRRTRQDFAMAEVLRKSTILKGDSIKQTVPASILGQHVELYTNPGYLEQKKKQSSKEGGLGGVALADLNRRGLLPPPPPFPQELQRGKSAVLQEKNMKMAVFALGVMGRQLYCAGSDQDVTIWNMDDWSCVGKLCGHKSWINALVFDEPRGLAYTASDDKTVRVWDLESRECVKVLSRLGGAAHSLALSDGELLVGCEGRLCVFGTEAWELRHRITNHTHVLRSMSDGKQMSKNLGVDERVAMARLPASLFGLRVGGLAAHAPYLLAAVDDGAVWVWDRESMLVERKLVALDARPGTWVRLLVTAAVADPRRGGKQRFKVMTGWSDGAIRVFDLQSWEHEHTLCGHNGPVLDLSIVAGRLVSAGADMIVLEWDPATWTIARRMTDHRGAVSAAVGVPALPSAAAAATAAAAAAAAKQPAPAGEKRAPTKGKGSAAAAAGEWLVTASVDGLLKVWSPE